MGKQSLGRATVAVGVIILAGVPLTGQSAPAAGSTGSNAPIGQAVLGYVVESPRLALRTILGIPGAARFSDPLPLPESATYARVAPGQAYALVEFANGDPAVLPLNGVTTGQATPIPKALQAADLVAFSPSGRSAVLYSATAGRLQVIAGLPAAPRILQDLDAGMLPGQPTAAAVSDDAGSVLLASDGAVDMLLSGGPIRRLLSLTGSAALTFFPNSSQAAIADRSAGSLYLVQRAGDSVSTMLLAIGLQAPDEMSATADGQGLLTTNRENRSIGFVNSRTGEMKTVTLPISPVRMDRLANMETFLIAAEPGQPAWIISRERSDVLATFVPAVPLSRRHPIVRRAGDR